ncbi:MAG: toll/interleukin-1 receptor domain-containing protein [Acidobacteriales bacterium]|nr:toll/interleukin-1 receptor domain-containing protein [Terriglobales bacterium]
MNPPERNMVFVSHANPEENELALWLSLQLASEGYAVWCDLTKLLGGEKFWEDIQDAISARTAKFVYILSRVSNQKRGTLDELDCAIGTEKRHQLKDFIITAKVDDLPYDDVYIGIRRLNHIDFNAWAKGLSILLEKFERDGVPRTPGFGHDAVCSWWRDQFSADAGVLEQPEHLLSNWFKVESIPSTLYEHKLSAVRPGAVSIEDTVFAYPAAWVSDVSFLSFAPAGEVCAAIGANLEIAATNEYRYEDVLSGVAVKDGPKYISQLFRMAWKAALEKRLSLYEMANNQLCFYFSGGLVKDDYIDFKTIDGEKAWRSVVGFKTLLGGRVRHWHYGITGKPILRPETLFVVKGHVLFSDDKKTLWDSKEATAKARRNQCKNWWNDDWRDRLLATMSHLAEDGETVRIPLAGSAVFTLSKFPILFESPVSYLQLKEIKKDDVEDYTFEVEDDELDEGEDGAGVAEEDSE